MTRVEMKTEAKEKLRGRWGNAIGFFLITAIAEGLVNFILVFIPVIGAIAAMIISVTITYNMVIGFLRFKRGEEIGMFDAVIKIPDNFVASWQVVWGVLQKMWIYIVAMIAIFIVLIVSVAGLSFSAMANGSNIPISDLGILGSLLFIAYFVVAILAVMKGLYYVFTQQAMFDSGNTLKGKEAAEQSEKLMQGQRGNYFVFILSFLGWAILAGFTFGIGYLWLAPYVMVATAVFYDSLAGTREVVIQENNEPITEE